MVVLRGVRTAPKTARMINNQQGRVCIMSCWNRWLEVWRREMISSVEARVSIKLNEWTGKAVRRQSRNKCACR